MADETPNFLKLIYLDIPESAKRDCRLNFISTLSFYVDDILLAGNNNRMVIGTKNWLFLYFEIKQLLYLESK